MRATSRNAPLDSARAMLRAGDRDAAERLLRRLLRACPRHPEALHLLGRSRFEAGSPGDAAALLRRAASVSPGTPAIWTDLADALLAEKDGAGTLAALDRAIALRPGAAPILVRRAQVLISSGRAAEALDALDEAVGTGPDAAPVHAMRASALRQLGRPAEAVAACDRALSLAPTWLPGRLSRALALVELGEDIEALTEVMILLALDPGHREARSCQGQLLRRLGRPAEALAILDAVLAEMPGDVSTLSGRAACLSDLGRHEEALAVADGLLDEEGTQNRAVILNRLGRHAEAADALAAPRTAEGWNARAHALIELGRFEEAIDGLDRAAAMHPANPNIPYNRGNALRGLNRHVEAVAAFEAARRLEPGFAEAEWNESLSRLALGDYAAGLRGYEARWRRRNHSRPHETAPPWTGDDPAGRTILLHAEQGLGDTIQMLRYVPLLAARGARVVMAVHRPLMPLAGRVAGASAVVALGDDLPDHDLRCPFMSLPLAFGTRVGTIPAAVPYLVPDPDRVASWGRALPRAPLRLGLVCSGNAGHSQDRHRSVPLPAFAPLLADGVAAFLVQTEVRDGDVAFLRGGRGIECLADGLTGFEETAALVANLDLLVCVDTSVAHLAGALGRPVHLLLPHLPDWRWLLDRADSPWYPTMRLHRRGRSETWDDVMARVAAEIVPLRLAA